MTDLGLILYDEEGFFSRVIKAGTEQGLFTRDRADEIIKVAVAMANKYVIQKEIDFRSEDELIKVQETIVKLIGVGLEIKSKGIVDDGVTILMIASPVDLFRIAYTRIEKLRIRWGKLLLNHKITIMVTKDEFECLSDLTCQRLSEMSIFTESELYTISSMTLEDELFVSFSLVEYYEKETEKYEFVLKLKEILPFDLLNKSPNVKAENLSEVDSIRESLISTLILSTYVDGSDPVTISMSEIRAFLETFNNVGSSDPFSEEIENAVLDIIQELGTGLHEHDASLLAREVIRVAQKLVDLIVSEWEVMSSSSEMTFFKRWSRLVIISDAPDPLERILNSNEKIDEFDFEMIVSYIMSKPENEARKLIQELPWANFVPEQIVRLFHEIEFYQEDLAKSVVIQQFSASQLIDLIEELTPKAFKKFANKLKSELAKAEFSLEELELLAKIDLPDIWTYIKYAGPPSDIEPGSAISDFKNASEYNKIVQFHASIRAEYFPKLFQELWISNQSFVKRQIKAIATGEMGDFLKHALPMELRDYVIHENESLNFPDRDVQLLYKSLPAMKKKAADKYFSR